MRGWGSIHFDRYEHLHMRVSKSLHPHFSRGLAKSMAREDWDHDRKWSSDGSPDEQEGLTLPQLEKSLGEMAELWAAEVLNADEDDDDSAEDAPHEVPAVAVIVKFLQLLFDNCTELDGQQQRQLTETLFQVKYLSMDTLREKLFLDELTTTLADSQPEKMATAGRGAGAADGAAASSAGAAAAADTGAPEAGGGRPAEITAETPGLDGHKDVAIAALAGADGFAAPAPRVLGAAPPPALR